MAKDKDTAERRAVDAMTMAIGTLHAFRSDVNGVQNVINKLESAIGSFDPRCDHEWAGAEDPRGGLVATCKKCGVVRRAQ